MNNPLNEKLELVRNRAGQGLDFDFESELGDGFPLADTEIKLTLWEPGRSTPLWTKDSQIDDAFTRNEQGWFVLFSATDLNYAIGEHRLVVELRLRSTSALIAQNRVPLYLVPDLTHETID